MTSIEERWQEIADLVRKKDRKQSQAERLHECVVGLLATPEGRMCIGKGLEQKKFEGRERFIEEVVRALDSRPAALAALTPRERSGMAIALLEKTERNQQCHWDILWLLLRDEWNGVGSLVIDSLTKGVPKKDDLATALWSLPAWKGLARERTVALLEAARQAARDFDLRGRIERALDWAKGSQPAPVAEPAQRVEEKPTASPEVAPAPTPTKPEPSEAPRRHDVIKAADLSSVLATINGAVEKFYRRLAEQVKRLEDEVGRLEEERRSLKEELGKQQDYGRELLAERTRLEERQSEHDRETATARQEARRLQEELTHAPKEQVF
jgi:hypothetical protein